MTGNDLKFGSSNEEMAALPTVFAPNLFDNKVALVSGAGSGLGKAIAVLFARLGANLVVCGRNPDKLNLAVQFFESLGTNVSAHAMTIRDPDAVNDMMDAVFEKHGKLDVLINNAGGQFPQAAIDYSVKGWNAVIDTNLNGTWHMMQAAARRWRDREQTGCIVNIVADIWRGMPGIAHTCAARAGVIYLSKSVAVEWAPLNIRVNCVAPGCVESTGFNNYPEEGAATFPESNPFRSTGDEQDVAEACVYLSASSGKFVTGEVITVDGGQQLWGDPWPTGRPDYFKI